MNDPNEGIETILPFFRYFIDITEIEMNDPNEGIETIKEGILAMLLQINRNE